MRDPYVILEVSPSATDDEIKKAYRTLSRRYHPDTNINNPKKDEAEEKFKEVQWAYDEVIRIRHNRGHNSNGGYYSSTSTGPGSSRAYYGSGGQNTSYSQTRNTSYNQTGQQTTYRQTGSYGQTGYYNANRSNGAYQNTAYSSRQNNAQYNRTAGFNTERAADGSYTYANGYREEMFDPHLRSAINYFRLQKYTEARVILDGMQTVNRDCFWFYYSGLTHFAMGNNAAALQHAQIAQMQLPQEPRFAELVNVLQNQSQDYGVRQANYGYPEKTNKDDGWQKWCAIALCIHFASPCC